MCLSGAHLSLPYYNVLAITEQEALSWEFRSGFPLELLHTYCRVQIRLLVKLNTWKAERVNMGKTKILVSGANLDLKKSGKDPDGVCLTGVGRNAIFCDGCFSLVNEKCRGIKDHLSRDARKPVFGVSDQVRHKPACTSSEKS